MTRLLANAFAEVSFHEKVIPAAREQDRGTCRAWSPLRSRTLGGVSGQKQNVLKMGEAARSEARSSSSMMNDSARIVGDR